VGVTEAQRMRSASNVTGSTAGGEVVISRPVA
jgi:hypothetical protein